MNILGMDLTWLGSGALNVGYIIIVAVIILGVGFAIYKAVRNYFRFQQFKCVIWTLDGFGNVTQEYDDAGIFVDDYTNNKRLWLKAAGVGLKIEQIPTITSATGKKLIYMLRWGEKDYSFIRPRINQEGLKMEVTEEDVNWSIYEYQKQKNLFGKKTLWDYLPYIMLALATMGIIILFMQLFNQIPKIDEMVKSLKEVAELLVEAKKASGTIVN